MTEPPDQHGDDERFFGEERAQEAEVAQTLKDREQREQNVQDAELPVYDDPEGSVFAGPANEAIPSSLSAYHSNNAKGNRRRSTKVIRRASVSVARSSTGSRAASSRPQLKRASSSRSSLPSAVSSSEDSDDEQEGRRRPKSRRSSSFRRKSRDGDGMSTTSTRHSHVSAAAGLRGRRSSVAHAPSTLDDPVEVDHLDSDENPSDDVYGPYGSSLSSDGSSADDSSTREGATNSGLFLTHGFIGGPDPYFGEHRVDMEDDSSSFRDHEEADKRVFDSLGGDVTGSKQPIYFPDEDLHVVFLGWGPKTWKVILWTIASVLTLGILPLLGRWFPHWWIQGKGKHRAFSRASAVVAHVS